MCVPACAHAGDAGHRESRHSDCVKIISPWLEEGSLHGKAILGIKKKKKSSKRAGGRLAGRVRGVARDMCVSTGILLSSSPRAHLPAAAPAPPAVPGRSRPAVGVGGCKGLAARADLVAGAVVQAVPGSRRSQRAHVTAPALR